MSKIPKFTLQEFLDQVDSWTTTDSVPAFLFLASAQWKKGDLSDVGFCAVLEKVSEYIKSHL